MRHSDGKEPDSHESALALEISKAAYQNIDATVSGQETIGVISRSQRDTANGQFAKFR